MLINLEFRIPEALLLFSRSFKTRFFGFKMDGKNARTPDSPDKTGLFNAKSKNAASAAEKS
jgi:hypothetical protein